MEMAENETHWELDKELGDPFGDEEADEKAILRFIAEHPVPGGLDKYLPIGAVLVAAAGEPFETVALMGGKADFREELGDAWGVSNREEALKTLEWLMTEGHAAQYGDDYLKFKTGKTHGLDGDAVTGYNDTVGAIADELPALLRATRECGTLRAWDLDRVGYLVRVFAHVGWLAELDVWDWLGRAAEEIRETFDAWEDYVASLLIGRGVAMGFHMLPLAAACDLFEEGRGFLDSFPVETL
jgi:hypothetical protein